MKKKAGSKLQKTDVFVTEEEKIQSNKRRIDQIDFLVDNYKKNILARIDNEYDKNTTWSDRLADELSSFGGSWKFIICFTAFLFGWIIWNSLSFTKHFDEAPFILLNLMLSFISAFQAPVIMMTQNRQALRDKDEAIIDYAINYKAEQEIRSVKNHLHEIEEDLKEIKKLLR
ncbi:DUF1003 domain-containing protein [Aneurinibacillus terranovensis]|uniref:DUF1003 domain-containing protein n=1 Tax=Aneurinibacillus terranovensis TaxID=278991 RepID=UPI000402FA60|nr:DUF1003 domain-containing protein [Aneurinibacillus terranovensis]